jgi:hypothetical protein
MKRYTEYTNEELIKLTSEQIEMMIDYECALAGVPLLPEKPIKPEVKAFEPDMSVYVIGSHHFLKQEDALKVLEAINSAQRTGYEWTNSVKRAVALKSYEQPQIETTRIFSDTLFSSIQNEKAVSDRIMKEYTNKEKEYSDVYQERTSIAKEVHEAIDVAHDENYKKQKYTAEYNRYLVLANNDSTIAINFLKNAHPQIMDIAGFVEYLEQL